MTSRDEALTDPQVDALLARLREAGLSQDPVPAAVLANAAAALELRDLDTALAALVADSYDVEEGLALVRGPQSTRLLTFEAPAVVVELQVVPAGSARQLEGHVDGADGWELSLEHAGGVLPVTPDEHGRFRVDAVPAGRMRLAMRDGAHTVTTTWVTV
jgi:hypothetical protein